MTSTWKDGLLTAGAAVGMAGLGTLAYSRWIERLRIEVKRMRVVVDSPAVPSQGLRILHLSDLHFTDHGLIERLKIRRTQELLADETYDLLLITGDLIHDDEGLPATLSFIDGLPEPRLGAFACLGNHDYAGYSWFGPAHVAWREAEPGQELQAAIERTVEMCVRIVKNDRLYLGHVRNDVPLLKQKLEMHGVHVLDNDSLTIQSDGVELWLAGLDDLMEGQPDVEQITKAMPGNGTLRILLAHNPDYMLDPALQAFDLAFSGHVHGGQVRLPFIGSPHTQGTHLSRRLSSGWFRYGKTKTYISRGLGEGVRLRFNCRPEVALIEVVPAR
ncbi:MAG: metallophosphoesterase [Chloroflexota bacterium]|nr:metallophosphoesterase [Chloroflexota bacterium]